MVAIHPLLIANNTAIHTGGAVHLYSTNVTFLSEYITVVGDLTKSDGVTKIFSKGSYKLVGNQADYGGAIYVGKSKLVVEVNSWTNVSNNLAMYHGDGLYMIMSE